MKLFRFMSKEEFNKLVKGATLNNKKIHTGNTNSIGFCFMEGNEKDAEYSYEFLGGCVSDDVCVIFETEEKLNKSWGIYADPYGSFFDTIEKIEYCTETYSFKKFKPIKYATNVRYIWDDEDKWIWEDFNNEVE